MTFEYKDFTGSLFKNDRRENDNQPNAKGQCKIGGVLYWVSAWTKKDKNGNPWQSLSFEPVMRGTKPEAPKPSTHKPAAIDDSDVPF